MSDHTSQQDSVKGKGKATATTSDEGNPDDSGAATGTTATSDDFSSRLTNSATHLARSLLAGRPDSADLARLSSAGGTKTEAAGSRQLPRDGENSSASARQGSLAASGNGAFRSTTLTEAEAHAARSEAEFSEFLDGTSVSLPSGRSALDDAWAAAQNGGQGSREILPSVPTGSVSEQEARDGLEVIDLLARPEAEHEPVPEEDMSATEAAALRSALFGPESGGPVSSLQWDKLLNFIPDFVRPDSGAVPGSVNAVKSAESQMASGLPHGPEAEKAWLDQWMGVLTGYNEEVWGDLGSLVQQAKEEIQKLEDSQPGEAPPGTKAVRRLQQILGHIRGG